jgi:hypothetical protein
VVPLIGLATSLRALGAAMLRSTRSALWRAAKVLGDEETADRVSGFGPDMIESGCKPRTGAIWQQWNRFCRARLMRPQRCGRRSRGNLDGAALGETRGLWIAQGSNCAARPCVAEIPTATGVEPWIVPDEVLPDTRRALEHRRGESDSANCRERKQGWDLWKLGWY